MDISETYQNGDIAKTYAAALGNYCEREYRFREIRRCIMHSVCGDWKNGDQSRSFLDVGCAIGANLLAFVDVCGGVGVGMKTGIDICPQMVEEAQDRMARYFAGEDRPARHPDNYPKVQQIDFAHFPTSTTFDLIYAQAFVHLFTIEYAKQYIRKMCCISKDRVYLSTTLHESSSEGWEIKDCAANGGRRFRHRYTKDEWINMIRSVADRPFVCWELVDPDGKLWINTLMFNPYIVLFPHPDFMSIASSGGIIPGRPPIVQELYQNQGMVVVYNAITLRLNEVISQFVTRLRTAKYEELTAVEQQVLLRYERGPGEFDRIENLAALPNDLIKLVTHQLAEIRSWVDVGGTGNGLDEKWKLLKDKLNFKMPGGSAFPPHQDAAAGWCDLAKKHMNVALALDPASRELGNGVLEFVLGPWDKLECGLLGGPNPLDLEGEHRHVGPWSDCPVESGDVVIFSSFIPHRSGPNLNPRGLGLGLERKMWFLTFVSEVVDVEGVREFSSRKRKRQPTMDDGVPADLPRDAFGKILRLS